MVSLTPETKCNSPEVRNSFSQQEKKKNNTNNWEGGWGTFLLLPVPGGGERA